MIAFSDHIDYKKAQDRRENQLLDTQVIKKLPKGYYITRNDICWLNYVHLVCCSMIQDGSSKDMSYWQICRSAIEWLTIDKWIKHIDPYELWIDAKILDIDLNDFTPTTKDDTKNRKTKAEQANIALKMAWNGTEKSRNSKRTTTMTDR